MVVTGGGDGALAMTAQASARAKGRRVEVVDTVGAGDTFMGNLLAGLQRATLGRETDLDTLSETDLQEILQIANTAAAINCTRKGCQPPSLSETQGQLKELQTQNG